MCILRCELLEAVEVDHDVFLIVMTCFLQTQVSCTGRFAQDVHFCLALCNKGIGKHVYRLNGNPKINLYRLKGTPKMNLYHKSGTLKGWDTEDFGVPRTPSASDSAEPSIRPCLPRCGPCDRYPRTCARMYSERAKDRTCLDSTNWPRRCGPKTRTIFDRGFPSAWSTHSVLSESISMAGFDLASSCPCKRAILD